MVVGADAPKALLGNEQRDANWFAKPDATAWLRARNVFAGEDAANAARERYLRRLDSQTDDEYLAYESRASFY